MNQYPDEYVHVLTSKVDRFREYITFLESCIHSAAVAPSRDMFGITDEDMQSIEEVFPSLAGHILYRDRDGNPDWDRTKREMEQQP